MAEYYFFDEENELGYTYLTPSVYVGALPCPYESIDNPDIFLDFAIDDRKQNDLRGLVNSFGNVKKAIHLRIDMLLHRYGLFHHYKRSNFPTKINLLDKIGLLPTIMVRNLNSERNLLEHEYVVPNEIRVDEAIDVTQLLYMATEKLVNSSIIEAVIGVKQEPFHRVVRLEPNCGEIHFFDLDIGNNFKEDDHGLKYISGRLREFGTGNVLPFYKVAEQSTNVILNNSNESNWLPIIKLLVDINRETFKGKANKEGGIVTTTVTFPMTEYEQSKLTEFLTRKTAETKEKHEQNNSG